MLRDRGMKLDGPSDFWSIANKYLISINQSRDMALP